QNDQQTLGVNSSQILGHFAEIDLAVAASHSRQGLGSLGLIGIQRKTSFYNLGIRATTASDGFRQLGLQDNQLSPQTVLQSNASISHAYWGSLSVSYTNRIGRTEPNIALTTLSYKRS